MFDIKARLPIARALFDVATHVNVEILLPMHSIM
jgi:hypothetical protein